jgi:hypothetical protein
MSATLALVKQNGFHGCTFGVGLIRRALSITRGDCQVHTTSLLSALSYFGSDCSIQKCFHRDLRLQIRELVTAARAIATEPTSESASELVQVLYIYFFCFLG